MKNNINKLNLLDTTVGNYRRDEIMSMPLVGNNISPKPITYEMIDEEMTKFIDQELNITFDGSNLKTFFFSQQRFNEFTKTWEITDDEDHSPIPNFKIVVRETNPKPGNLHGGFFNIPGEPLFNLGKFEKWDGEKNISVTYKMKQPYCVDLIYNVKFITNRLDLLNNLNNQVINKFKSIQNYLTINGHYMPMKLENVDDESTYDLDDRKIFAQTFQITLFAYIINEDDIIIEENKSNLVLGLGINKTKSILQKDLKNRLVLSVAANDNCMSTFKINDFYDITSITTNANITDYIIKVNNKAVVPPFSLKQYDTITIKINRVSLNKISYIYLSVG